MVFIFAGFEFLPEDPEVPERYKYGYYIHNGMPKSIIEGDKIYWD